MQTPLTNLAHCGILGYQGKLDRKEAKEMGADRNIWRAGGGRGHRAQPFQCPWCGERFHSVFQANAHIDLCSKKVKKEAGGQNGFGCT